MRESLGYMTVELIEEYCLESSLLGSLHVKFGDASLNLWIEVRGDHIIFENSIHEISWPEIYAAFSTDVIQVSKVF